MHMEFPQCLELGRMSQCFVHVHDLYCVNIFHICFAFICLQLQYIFMHFKPIKRIPSHRNICSLSLEGIVIS